MNKKKRYKKMDLVRNYFKVQPSLSFDFVIFTLKKLYCGRRYIEWMIKRRVNMHKI